LSIILMIFFIGKISKLGHDLPATSSESNWPHFQRQRCNLEFCEVSVEEVKKWLLSIKNDKPFGSDNLVVDDFAMKMLPGPMHSANCTVWWRRNNGLGMCFMVWLVVSSSVGKT
jgi:hypothetical protein